MVNNQLKKMGLFLGKKNSSLNQILLGRPSHWSNWLVNQVFVHPSLVLPEPIQSPSPELTYRAGPGLITMVFTVIVDSLLWIGIITLFIYPLIKKIGLEASFIFFFTVRMSLFIYIYIVKILISLKEQKSVRMPNKDFFGFFIMHVQYKYEFNIELDKKKE